jgi:outer membrane protein OmpA-like peptidoglycan-associated protein/uncharacterized protein YegP (UPF0339 family)
MDDNNLNNQRQDDYLACNLYKGKTASPEGIYKFTEEGKFYFSFMENGNVILRSEGYTNEAGRENGIKSVLNNIEDENLHKVLKLNDGTWVVVLNAGNHQEIARSCPFNTEAEALGLFPVARAAARAALLLTATPIAAAAIPKINNIDKDDDYLLCSEYSGHSVTDKQNNIALFTHSNGQHYFVAYNNDGSVKLRSEGFSNTTDRDDELSDVINHINSSSNYTRIEKAGYEIKILKNNNGREIGRTCPKKILTAAPIAAEVPAAGGFKWWWLVGLLALLGLFLLWRSCDKPAAEVTVPEPVVEATAPVINDTIKDTDGDGVYDNVDKCPNLAGIEDNLGCPDLTIYYLRDEAQLGVDDKAQLDKVVAFLESNQDLNVELQGYTSTLGEEAYNLTLSEKRATQAKEYLVSKGINVSRLKAKGYGETNTIGDQNTEEGRAKSRRTIVKVAK